jgi:cytidylate kinase
MTVRSRLPFTVTISREAGALGSSVAGEVGRRLNWPVYDREILDKIAEELRRPRSHLEAVDERPGSWLEECLSGLLGEYHVSTHSYLKYLLGAVRGLGALGRCVIVGRAANVILPAETTLRIRLVARLEDRVQVIARRRGLSAREAAAWVEATEREREAFVKRHFGQDPTDPHHYDLVLNMSRLSLDEGADAIVGVLRQFEARADSGAHKPGSTASSGAGPT